MSPGIFLYNQRMEPRLNIVTLGVYDLNRSVAFYRDGLGWHPSGASVNDFVIFKLSTGTALALYPRHLLAEDANLKDGSGFGGITLAHNVPERAMVDQVLSQAVAAGGVLLKPAQEAVWGGYSGYFGDPDGYPWEVAWNPFLPITDGQIVLPE
jgi:catechol 2,3-dioxygenase-like lactoylglutathione lyase family enzyme